MPAPHSKGTQSYGLPRQFVNTRAAGRTRRTCNCGSNNRRHRRSAHAFRYQCSAPILGPMARDRYERGQLRRARRASVESCGTATRCRPTATARSLSCPRTPLLRRRECRTRQARARGSARRPWSAPAAAGEVFLRGRALRRGGPHAAFDRRPCPAPPHGRASAPRFDVGAGECGPARNYRIVAAAMSVTASGPGSRRVAERARQCPGR